MDPINLSDLSTDDAANIKSKLTPLHAVALTLWGEARGELIEGIVGVGCVIRNRRQTGRWGQDWAGIVHARWQFSCWEPRGGWDSPNDSDTISDNYVAVMRAAYTLVNGHMLIGREWDECMWVAQGIMEDKIRDRVYRATHYCTTDLLKNDPPDWAKGKRPVRVIWNHAYFANIK
jgi:hypothetical protein